MCRSVCVCVCVFMFSDFFPGIASTDLNLELVQATTECSKWLEVRRVETAKVYYNLATWASAVLTALTPKWHEDLKSENVKNLKENMVDNPNVRLLRQVSTKAKSILKVFNVCDSAVKVADLVEGFDTVLSKLNDSLEEAAKTNAVHLGPDLKSSDTCCTWFSTLTIC